MGLQSIDNRECGNLHSLSLTVVTHQSTTVHKTRDMLNEYRKNVTDDSHNIPSHT